MPYSGLNITGCCVLLILRQHSGAAKKSSGNASEQWEQKSGGSAMLESVHNADSEGISVVLGRSAKPQYFRR